MKKESIFDELKAELSKKSTFYLPREKEEYLLRHIKKIPRDTVFNFLMETVPLIFDGERIRSASYSRGKFLLTCIEKAITAETAKTVQDETFYLMLHMIIRFGTNSSGMPDTSMLKWIRLFGKKRIRGKLARLHESCLSAKSIELYREFRLLAALSGGSEGMDIFLQSFQKSIYLTDFVHLVWVSVLSKKVLLHVQNRKYPVLEGSKHIVTDQCIKDSELLVQLIENLSLFEQVFCLCADLSKEKLVFVNEIDHGDWDGYQYDDTTDRGKRLLFLLKCLSGIIYFLKGPQYKKALDIIKMSKTGKRNLSILTTDGSSIAVAKISPVDFIIKVRSGSPGFKYPSL